MAIRGIDIRYTISCPECGKAHYFNDEYVDDIVECSCGFEFYAFAKDNLRIVMSADEARCDTVVRSTRRFVMSTGRFRNMSPELYIDRDGQECFELMPQELDTEEELERILDEYQTAAYGKKIVSRELLDSICESLDKGSDIELKKQKNGIDVIELKKKRVNTQRADNSRRLSEYTQLTADMLKSGRLFNMDR